MGKFVKVIEGIEGTLNRNGHSRYEEKHETKDGDYITLVALDASTPYKDKPVIDMFGLVTQDDGSKKVIHLRDLHKYISSGKMLGFKLRSGEKFGYKNYGKRKSADE